jgi:Flp pilus assembly protein TadD
MIHELRNQQCMKSFTFALRPVLPASLALFVAMPAHAKDALPALIKKVKPAIVTILSYDPDKAMPTIGTGFLVTGDTLVTARHVVRNVNRAEARTCNGQVLKVTGVLAEDRSYDLVMLQLERRPANVAVLKLARAMPEQGESLSTVSSPLGLEWSASVGIVANTHSEVGQAIQHTVQVSVGSSGCPLMNAKGEVVAVQVSSITVGQPTVAAGQGLNFAVPAVRVAALKPGPPRPLAEYQKDLAAGEPPDINRRLDRASLAPLARDDFKGALAFFQAAVARVPEEPDAWFRLGLCYERISEPEQALEHYLKAVELNPNLAVAHNNLGAVYNRMEKYEMAVPHLKQAVQLNPKQATAYNSLAHAYNRLKQYADAATSAKEAVRLSSRDADAVFNLGFAYGKLGQKTRAQDQVKKLENLNPQLARQLQKVLEEE